MAFSTPSVHRVATIECDVIAGPGIGHATLSMTFHQHSFKNLSDGDYPAHLDIFGDSAMADKFERAAAAINAIFAEAEQPVRQAAE